MGLAPSSPIISDMNSQFSLNGDNPTFSYYFNDNLEDSFMEFGPMDPTLYEGEITWLPILPDVDMWSSEISGVRFESPELETGSIEFSVPRTRIDTITNNRCIHGPEKEIKFLLKAFSDATTGNLTENQWGTAQYVFPCTDYNYA